jgi:hypothetical protein
MADILPTTDAEPLACVRMGASIVGVIGVVLGALVGVLGGYVTARQHARVERDRQLRDLAVEVTKLELTRTPDSPFGAAEYVAVLTQLLRRLDVELEDEYLNAKAVDSFRDSFCAQCGAHLSQPALPKPNLCLECKSANL